MTKIPDAAVRAIEKIKKIAGSFINEGSRDYPQEVCSALKNVGLELLDAVSDIPHLPLGFEVKKLEFKYNEGVIRARSVVGWYEIWQYKENGKFRFTLHTFDDEVDGKFLNTEEAAKAAAQADYESRVRECVIGKPSDYAKPDFYAVHTKSGMHIGLWPDKANADEALLEYEGGKITPLFTKPVDVAVVRRQAFDEALNAVGRVKDNFMSDEYAMPQPIGSLHERLACDAVIEAVLALSADPAQAGFANADWYYRDNDPDDNGDTAYEAIINHPEYSIHLVHSSYRGDSRYVFRAPTLDPSDDDDEVLNFETEEEAIAAATERKEAIASLPAAPTTEAGR